MALDPKEIEQTYSEVTMGVVEPDCICMPAGVARDKFSLDIPAEVPDDQYIMVGRGGIWEVMG